MKAFSAWLSGLHSASLLLTWPSSKRQDVAISGYVNDYIGYVQRGGHVCNCEQQMAPDEWLGQRRLVTAQVTELQASLLVTAMLWQRTDAEH